MRKAVEVAARAAAAKAVVAEEASPAVVVDKVVVEEADARVVGADPLVVVAEREEAVRREAVAVVVAQAVEAAEAASPYLSPGRRGFATPCFFIDALHRRGSMLAAVDRAAFRHVSPAPSLTLAR